VAVAASQALGQTPSKEYIRLGGRVIAIENALTIPSAPTALTATGGSAQVVLNWTGSSGAQSYKVYRGTTSNGENATPIATGVTPTTYTDTTVTNGTTYYYKVAAVNTLGTSAQSNEAYATPLCAPLTLVFQNQTLAPGTYQACTSITVLPGVTINPTVTLILIQ
jgi:cellulose 1,4-beta-cellobiosidase